MVDDGLGCYTNWLVVEYELPFNERHSYLPVFMANVGLFYMLNVSIIKEHNDMITCTPTI